MMKRRREVSVAIGGLMLAGLIFALCQPSRVILGTLAGEQFFNGFPSSYWGSQLSGNPAARADALTKLEQSGDKSLNVLRELLRTHPAAEVRLTAVELIGKVGPAAQVAGDDVMLATKDKDSHVRALAAKTIPQIETPAANAVPILIPLLDSEHAGVVARALSVYRQEARAALPNLVALLQNESKDVETRWNAARTLGKLGPEGLEALPVLIEFTQHSEDTIREHAAEAIGDIGPVAKDGIPALVACLDDPAVKVRRDAVRSLGYIGDAARTAVPQIRPLLDDPEEIVRIAAVNALKIIAPEEVPEKKAEPPQTPPVEKNDKPKAPSA